MKDAGRNVCTRSEGEAELMLSREPEDIMQKGKGGKFDTACRSRIIFAVHWMKEEKATLRMPCMWCNS